MKMEIILEQIYKELSCCSLALNKADKLHHCCMLLGGFEPNLVKSKTTVDYECLSRLATSVIFLRPSVLPLCIRHSNYSFRPSHLPSTFYFPIKRIKMTIRSLNNGATKTTLIPKDFLVLMMMTLVFSFRGKWIDAFTRKVIRPDCKSNVRFRRTMIFAAGSTKNVDDYPFQHQQEIELKIDSLTSLGMGVGRIPLGDKMNTTWVIFVPYTIPGEIVKAKIKQNSKSYSEASLVEIVSSSEDRIYDVPCPYFGTCGGCQYQHMTIDKQREWKTKQVESAMERIGGFSLVGSGEETVSCDPPQILPTIGTNEVYKYRSKLTPRFDFDMKIGFQSNNNGPLIDIISCPLASDAINEEYLELRQELRQQQPSKSKRQKNAGLLLRETIDGKIVTDPQEYVNTTVGSGLKLSFRAGNFFQINPHMLDKMISLVMQAATKEMTYFIDCYCGSGLFALAAAATGNFDSCVGIEINEAAIEEAKANAVLNQLEHKCNFIAASASTLFKNKKVKMLHRDETIVMVDPPRKGCSFDFLKQLCEGFQPKRILYLSCNIATQARDAKIIVGERNKYRITSVQPLDLFPQTRHIECLMVFEKC